MQSIKQQLMHLSRPIGRESLWKIFGMRYRCMCTNNDGIGKPRLSLVTNPAALDKSRGELQIDWDKEIGLIEKEEQIQGRSILAPVDDESEIYAEPMLRPAYNLAAYVQKSKTLQQLMKLGVNLDRLNEKRAGQFIANLDFKRDIEPYVLLLTKDIVVPVEEIGEFFTKNPDIFKQSLDDIKVRINYLQLKQFTCKEIASIVSRNPIWLNFSTREIDDRLGFFQKDFQLKGSEVRALTVAYPKLITYNLNQIKDMSFSIREECCFEPEQVKEILLKCPRLWMLHRLDFMQRYDFVSYHMKIDNSHIAKDPYILAVRLFKIKERHGFLKKIGRAQYNPKLELYVALSEISKGTDEEFATNLAKQPYEEFDRYLRTL